jgi:hypothetical protein
MVKNKHGWIRMLEVVLAITLFSSVLIVVYTQQNQSADRKEQVFFIQERISNEISTNDVLRNMVLSNSEKELNDYFYDYFTSDLGYRIRICELEKEPVPCKLNFTDYSSLINTEIFVEDLIISGNLTLYDPKIVNIFSWYNV